MNYPIEEILLRVYQKKYLKNLQFVIYIEYKNKLCQAIIIIV